MEKITPAIVFAIAQLDLIPAWVGALLNGGALGCWVIYMAWRDNRESIKADKKHQENLEAQKENASNIRTLTELLTVFVGGVKTMDSGFAALMERFKAQENKK